MLTCKKSYTTTIDTKYEYEGDKVVREIVTETREHPSYDDALTTITTSTNDDDDCDVDITTESEVEASLSEAIKTVAGIAAIVTSACLLFKALKNKE